MLQTVGRRFIQVPTDRPALAAQEWTSVLNSIGALKDRRTHTEKFHFWRISQSIRDNLFQQDLLLMLRINVLLPPTLLHGESASYLDYPSASTSCCNRAL